MLRTILAGVGVAFLLLGFRGVKAEELETEPFLYIQGFEEVDPVKFWTSNGEYTINFKGLTEEKSFSGKKSFKLDVVFKEGGYFYWDIPIGVPAEGKLKFSGRILLGEGTTGVAGLGVNVTFPPTSHSGCSPFARYQLKDYQLKETKGEWKLIEGDPVKFGKRTADGVISKLVWATKGENVGVYVNMIGLFIYGNKGQRVVVYVDDIKIEGKVPTEETYKEEIKKRWTPAKERFSKKIDSWETALKEGKEQISFLTTNLSPEAEKMKKEAEEKIFSLKARVEKIRGRGFINLSAQNKIDSFLTQQLKSIINNIKLISKGRVRGKDTLVYVVSPISSVKILPFDTYIPGEISNEIRIVASPGEYEPGSFVVCPLSDIKGLKVEASPLKGKQGVIPSSNVDIKIVKCWYQAGTAWFAITQDKSKRVLVPELLLNDDTLIKVDYKEEKNYLKLNGKYVWMSNPDEPEGDKSRILSVKGYPVKDSPVLLPVDIPARTNRQFWITVKVPDTAREGIYTGSIILFSGKERLAALTLKLKVLPFKLASPKTYYDLKENFVSSIYYRAKLHPDWPEGSISSEYKSKQQLREELENMFAHGVTNPTVYQHFDEKLLGEYLRIRNEVGMANQPLYYLGVGASSNPDTIKKVLEFTKSYGIPEVYFYGRDEARGERLKSQRNAWEATHKAGGKVFVAGYRGSSFGAMGDIQDLLVCAGYPSKEEAAKWHSVGHKIFCYANPQGGVENPEIYRRNFGLLLWKSNYDGACTYAYQHSFDNIWNDFDSSYCRDHNFTYPTVDGVITTIALEGYREGIDDIRYATTLRIEIEKAKMSRDKRIKKVAIEAEKYLEKLDTDRDLDLIRLEMINYILLLIGRK